jgi:hypothetical protein
MRGLREAEERLGQVEQLLLRPTPEAIREADELLAAIGVLLRESRAAECARCLPADA